MNDKMTVSKQGHIFYNQVATPVGRVCNVWLKNAKTAEHDKKFPDDKYQLELLIPKANKHMLRGMFDACTEIFNEITKPGGLWHGKVSTIQEIVLPFLDGDQSAEKYPHYAGMYRIHPKRKMDQGRPDVRGPQKEIIDPGDVYAGSYGRAVVTLYTYQSSANERVTDPVTKAVSIKPMTTYGITSILELYQFWKDGEPIVFRKAGASNVDAVLDTLPEGETALPPPKAAKSTPAPAAAPTAAAAAGDGMPF